MLKSSIYEKSIPIKKVNNNFNLYKNTKPLLLAKDIAKIFRNKTETENKNETKKEE